MHSFRLRLILVLVACVTVVSVASTYFEVLAHKHFLREELEQATKRMGLGLQPYLEQTLASGDAAAVSRLLGSFREQSGLMALAVLDRTDRPITSTGPSNVLSALSPALVEKAMRRGAEESAFGHADGVQWLEEVIPLHNGNQLEGAFIVVADAGYIRSQGYDVWWRSFARIGEMVLLISVVTFVMVRWFLMRPMMRVAERLRKLRSGHPGEPIDTSGNDFSMFTPLAREVETMAESLAAARAAAEAEARLRAAGESLWTAERLSVHMREHFGSSRIFVVSNREPYMHVRRRTQD